MYRAREMHVQIRKRYFAGKTRDGCKKAQPGSAAGLPVLSEVLRNPITLQFYTEPLHRPLRPVTVLLLFLCRLRFPHRRLENGHDLVHAAKI